jgi:hypothetical protein
MHYFQHVEQNPFFMHQNSHFDWTKACNVKSGALIAVKQGRRSIPYPDNQQEAIRGPNQSRKLQADS